MSFTGNNRNSSIANLGQASAGLSFYISSSLLIDAGTGPNNSAVFNSIPIDQGVIGIPFLHAPSASDAIDHDSLSFELVTPRQGPLTGIIDPCDSAFDIASYRPLDQFATGPRTFRIDPATGLITWDSPALVGLYNIAYVVKEWRRLSPEVVRMVGSTTRDMQISITDSRNKPPVLRLPADTCVIAGRPIDVLITATDPEGFAVTLTGEGGAFVNTPAATLTPVPGGRRDSVTMRFRWTPNCRSVARQPYLTTLSARDTPPNCDTELAAIGVWQVRVVGPPPDSLVAEDVMLSQVRLRWKPYACAGTADSIRI